MERRALLLALALILPLALYGVPYAYAATTSTYEKFSSQDSVPAGTYLLSATCNTGDYATGGGAGAGGPGGRVNALGPIPAGDGLQPTGWGAQVTAAGSGTFTIYVDAVCQKPITVAGIGVPEFGSLYVAIALGAVAYFLLSRRITTRLTNSSKV